MNAYRVKAWCGWGGGVFTSCCCGSNCSLARAVDGRISAAAPLALANQLPVPMIVKCSCKTRYIRITGFSFSFLVLNLTINLSVQSFFAV